MVQLWTGQWMALDKGGERGREIARLKDGGLAHRVHSHPKGVEALKILLEFLGALVQ